MAHPLPGGGCRVVYTADDEEKDRQRGLEVVMAPIVAMGLTRLTAQEDRFIKDLLRRKHRTFSLQLYELFDTPEFLFRFIQYDHVRGEWCFDYCNGWITCVISMDTITFHFPLKRHSGQPWSEKRHHLCKFCVEWSRKRACICGISVLGYGWNVSLDLFRRAIRWYRERRARMVQKAAAQFYPLDLAVMIADYGRDPPPPPATTPNVELVVL